MDRLAARGERGGAPRPVPVPGHAARRGAARGPLPVPVRRIRRAGLGVRARRRAAHGRADLRPDLGADGCRARRRPAARRPGHRGARRRAVRHRPRRGPVRPAAAGRGSGPGRGRRPAPGRPAALAPAGLGRRRRRAQRVRRLPGRGGLPRRLVPQPVLVPAGRLRRRAAVPGHPRPDAARQPAHEHGVREVLQLAAGAEPGLPGGHAARVRRRRRGARRTGTLRSRVRPAPPGRRGVRAEPAGQHRPADPTPAERDLICAACTAAQMALNLAVYRRCRGPRGSGSLAPREAS